MLARFKFCSALSSPVLLQAKNAAVAALLVQTPAIHYAEGYEQHPDGPGHDATHAIRVEEASLMKKQFASAPALGLNDLVVYVKLTSAS